MMGKPNSARFSWPIILEGFFSGFSFPNFEAAVNHPSRITPVFLSIAVLVLAIENIIGTDAGSLLLKGDIKANCEKASSIINYI